MSYCRFGDDSDVYIYATDKYLVCESCKLKNGKAFATLRYSRMLAHVESHVNNGDKVPKNVLEELTLSFILGDDNITITHLN